MKLWIDTHEAAPSAALFGVAPVERLRRSAGKLDDAHEVVLSGPCAGDSHWPGARVDVDTRALGVRLRAELERSDGGLVVVDGDDAVDPRLIRFLVGGRGACIASRGTGAHRGVVLRLDAAAAIAIPPGARDLREVADALAGAGVPQVDERAFPSYVDKLRRALPYWIWRVGDDATRRRLERQMFWDNYKGSTDLLTRWVFPPLVWPMTLFCTRFRIHPNVVTAISIVFTVAAVPLFAAGEWAWGFACAYGMAVLDSVDGKVARVTLTDSRIGNVLDHGLDLVHPPFWYFAWAWGLGARTTDDPLMIAAIAFIVFYWLDRLALKVAKRRIGFALHAATPLDGRVRSFIARRNITMTVMLFAWLLGQPVIGFWIVTLWQALTFGWHASRALLLGFLAREHARPEAS